MDELAEAAAKIREAHDHGVDLSEYLAAEAVLGETPTIDLLRQAVGRLAQISAAHNAALALILKHLTDVS